MSSFGPSITPPPASTRSDRPAPPSTAARPAAITRRAWAGWLLVASLLVLQYVLFRRFVVREVAWAFPRRFDQVGYLTAAYETYEYMRAHGVLRGVWHHFSSAAQVGPLVSLQASLVFMLLGPSRLAALTVNFAAFAVFQCVVVATLCWLTGRWSVALLGLGLLLTAKWPFAGAGGMMDFRLEFAILCLYGVLVGLTLRSGLFRSRGVSLVVGAVAAALALSRLVTLVYLAGVAAVFVGYLAVRVARPGGRRDRREDTRARLRGLGTAAVVVLLLTGPVLVHSLPFLYRYYVVGHVTGPDREIRMREAGIHSTSDALLYYPRALARYYPAGRLFWAVSALSVAFAGGLALLRRRPAGTATVSGPTLVRLDGRAATVWVGACLLVPWVALTLHPTKIYTVGSILMPPLLWLTMLAVAFAAAGTGTRAWRRAVRYGLPVLAAVSLGAGLGMQLTSLSGPWALSWERPDIERAMRLIERIGAVSRQAGWDAPVVFSNVVWDGFMPAVVMPVLYERHRVVLRARVPPGGGGLYAVSEEEALRQLRESDFAIIARWDSPADSPYPVDRSMHRVLPALRAFCDRQFVRLERVRMTQGDVVLYVRPFTPAPASPVSRTDARQLVSEAGSPGTHRADPGTTAPDAVARDLPSLPPGRRL